MVDETGHENEQLQAQSNLPETEEDVTQVAESTDELGELPDQASEKTRQQFEKLKENNRKLKQQLDSLSGTKPTKNLIDDLFPQMEQQQSQGVTPQSNKFVDDEGYVDMQALNARLDALNEQAMQAKQEALIARQQVERYEHSKEIRQAYEEYPQLDPDSENFDPTFYDLVKKHIVGQMYETGKGSILKASRAIGNLSGLKAQKEKESQKVAEDLQNRDNASRTASGTNRAPVVKLDDLKSRSLRGDLDAIAERLKASGY